MRTPHSITVYNKYINPATRAEVFQRVQINDVAWESRKAANVLASGGNISVDTARVFIPFAGHDTDYLQPKEWQALAVKTGKWTLQVGDIIVKGLIDDDIETGYTASDLKSEYNDVLVISSVDTMDAGSVNMRHWNVGAK